MMEKAEMKQIQKEVTEWAEKTFPNSTPQAKILHLWEELEEIMKEAILQSAPPEFREEIADAGLITLHLASLKNVAIPTISPEFECEMRIKFEICKLRKWQEPDENGVVRHV